jgi:excisionase family DNA binding protein
MSRLHAEISGNRTVGLADFLEGKPRALIVAEVAAILHVSPRLIYRLTAEGRIPCLRLAGCIRFDPADLAGWLRQRVAPADTSQEERKGLLSIEGRK